tara:strand:- start:348 stop:734 length:387 start_codon:yes stop_codon:yes gene_type:complete
VANLDLAWFRDEGEFAIQGRTFEIFLEVRKTTFKDLVLDEDDPPILLREDGRTIASATKPSAFRRSFDVVFDQTGYILQRVLGWPLCGRRFELAEGSQVVGSIHPVHGSVGRPSWSFPSTSFSKSKSS